MVSSFELPVERVRKVLRLVEQVHRREHDRAACLGALASGLRDIFGASVVIIAHSRDDDATTLHEIHSHGWRDDACRTLLLGTDPSRRASQAPLGPTADPARAVVTARRCSLFRDEEWAVHPHLIARCRPSGLDDFMASSAALAGRPGYRGVVLMYRDNSAPGFSDGDRELLHALHSESGARFWNAVLAATVPAVTIRPLDGFLPAQPAANGASNSTVPSRSALLARLTPAQRAVLPYLLEGKTEAEIGKLIFRSRYTVHDHARAIYLAMHVRNRVELVVLFNKAVDHQPAAN